MVITGHPFEMLAIPRSRLIDRSTECTPMFGVRRTPDQPDQPLWELALTTRRCTQHVELMEVALVDG